MCQSAHFSGSAILGVSIHTSVAEYLVHSPRQGGKHDAFVVAVILPRPLVCLRLKGGDVVQLVRGEPAGCLIVGGDEACDVVHSRTGGTAGSVDVVVPFIEVVIRLAGVRIGEGVKNGGSFGFCRAHVQKLQVPP